MSRSKIVERLLSKATKKKRKIFSLAFQLGYWVGKELFTNYTPSLSIDIIKSRKVISVTCAEGDEYRRLNDSWFEEKDKTIKDILWVKIKDMWSALADKYLPKTIDCHINYIDIEDKDLLEFKKGISSALWDSDGCNYSVDVDKINIRHTEFSTIITLVRE